MKLSKYNVWAQHGGREFVYNSRTGSLLQVPVGTEQSLIHAGVIAEADAPEAMVQGGMILPDSTDELALLRERYHVGRTTKSHLALTVISSLGCNFDCPYCYEDKRPEVIKPEVEQAILRFVDDRIARGLSSIAVQWLGGEPLLGKRNIVRMSHEFRERSERGGINYRSYITTNGSLLTRRVATELVEAGVRRAQITLDGPPDIHDMMRPTRRGDGTFWKILGNIEAAADVIPIVVRINVDRENFIHIDELLDILDARGLREKIEVYVGHLIAVDDGAAQPSASYTRACFNTKGFATTERYFNDSATARGFKSRVLDGPILTPCMAMREEEYVVGSGGELYKCWKSVGNDNEVVGSILEYGMPNSRVHRWLNYDPFEDAECVSCDALPVCMGGCAHHTFDKRLYEDRCTTFRYESRERVVQFIQQAEKAPVAATRPTLGEGSARRFRRPVIYLHPTE